MYPKFCNSITLALLAGTAGCLSQPQPADRNAAPAAIEANAHPDISVRNNALALLQNLLGDEQDVAKVLYLKSASDTTRRLLKDISATAKQYHSEIEAIAKQLPEYDVKNLALPPGEVAARKAESKTTEHAILHSHGADFEFEILLSQAQALDYGSHLAGLIAINETNSTRAGQFSALAQELNALYERTALLMKTKN
ncbi:MAG TPA: hypothetical protein VK742_08735 [Candidatus Sulfotelmatobacter sp.]|nr:hypothetical protein [Candidatus Sulfotelmatobacter sp.]